MIEAPKHETVRAISTFVRQCTSFVAEHSKSTANLSICGWVCNEAISKSNDSPQGNEREHVCLLHGFFNVSKSVFFFHDTHLFELYNPFLHK